MSVLAKAASDVQAIMLELEDKLPRFDDDKWKAAEIKELALAQKRAKELKEITDLLSKEVNKIHDFIRKQALPDCMAQVDEGMNSVKIEGVGSISIRTDIYASIAAGKQEDAKDWLFESGNEALIKETVNASSLKSFLKKCLTDGTQLPEGMFNVTPYSYTVITK